MRTDLLLILYKLHGEKETYTEGDISNPMLSLSPRWLHFDRCPGRYGQFTVLPIMSLRIAETNL